VVGSADFALFEVCGSLLVITKSRRLSEERESALVSTRFNYALAPLGSALITDRSKELTDSEEPKTEATSGSRTIATALPSI